MKYFKSLLMIGSLALLAAGCATSPSRFYTLNATAHRTVAPDATYGVIVGPVAMPAAVDRPQFVVMTAPNRVEVEEFNRWAAPLGDSIARVVSINLGEQLGTMRVASAPMPDFGPAYRVAIHVERFESVLGDGKQDGSAMLDAIWTVRGVNGENVVSGHFTLSEPAKGNSFEALAAAHSRLLEQLSAAIAVALTDVAGGKK